MRVNRRRAVSTSSFDFVRRRGADRLIVGVAHRIVVLDDAAQRRQRQKMCDNGPAVLRTDVEGQPIAGDTQVQRIRSAGMADRLKKILLEQIVDGDLTLMLDVGIGAADRFLVQRDGGEALLRSGRFCRVHL